MTADDIIIGMPVLPQTSLLVDIVSLSDLIDEYSPSALVAMLSTFRCRRNNDVQSFLHTDAIRFEQANKSRTYLAIARAPLPDQAAYPVILGYFTLALKYIQLNSNISRTQCKKLNGIFYPVGNIVVGYLLGQLGKDDGCSQRIGQQLLGAAMRFLRDAQHAVGGRFVLVECQKDAKLVAYYREYGFVELQMDSTDRMIQLVAIL
jgi:hypothetical protein